MGIDPTTCSPIAPGMSERSVVLKIHKTCRPEKQKVWDYSHTHSHTHSHTQPHTATHTATHSHTRVGNRGTTSKKSGWRKILRNCRAVLDVFRSGEERAVRRQSVLQRFARLQSINGGVDVLAPLNEHTHTHTHTHTHVGNRETRTKQEKRLKENSSGTAELS